jgi:hypothetical protein
MNWGDYYRLFGNLNALFSETIEIYDTITFKQANSSDIKHSTKELLDKAKGEFEALKRFYSIAKAENRNAYSLINLEIDRILPKFRNNEFFMVVDAKKGDKEVQTLLRHNLMDFKEGLEKQELNDVDGIEVILYYIYAYTKYWSWLQDQKPVYTYVEYIRSFEVNLDGTRYEEMNKEELFIGLILEQYVKPNQAFQEVTLFLDSLESETYRKTLLYYVRDRVYSLYQLEGIREAMNSKHKKSTKEALQAFYTAFMELLNSVYNVSERPSIDAPKEIAPPPTNSSTLIWNGNKNTLGDVFHQLTKLTNKDGKPFLGSSQDDILAFLKANFDVFQESTLGTIKTNFSSTDKKPKIDANKISLKRGFYKEN